MFTCTKCDAQFPKWSGRCETCQSWGTIQEWATDRSMKRTRGAAAAKSARILDLDETSQVVRIATQDPEVDRVLAGGLVPGCLLLLSGEPGIGKSTLVAQIASAISQHTGDVLYISGEESGPQLSSRFKRIGGLHERLSFLDARPIETLVSTIEKRSIRRSRSSIRCRR